MMPNTKSNPLTLKLIFLVMLAMVLSSVHAHAALTQNDVSMLYVSIFNRASEGEGNAFWRSQPGMAAAATAMLETEAAQNYFGSSLNSNQAFIEHIYLNTLNKNPWDDPSGIAHWVGRLDSGSTRGEVVADLVGVIKDYAPGGIYYNPNDPVTIAAYNQFTNRVEVSNYMADTVQTPPANWQTATQFGPGGLTVTAAPATKDTAKQAINLIAGNSGGSLEDDIHYYMAMITSAGELTPMVDELSILLGTILSGDPSVVTITPALQTIDLNNPPSNINITADFGNGYTPPDTTAVYTGRTVINLTGISFTQTGIRANATLNATNVQRNGEPILNGLMTLSLNVGMSGDNTSVTANINFSNISSMGSQANGGIALNIPAISGEGQLLQPVTITLNQFSAQDYQMNGTVTMTQVSAEVFDVNFNITTNQGPVTGILRAQVNPANMDQMILTTPSGPLTVETATLTFNQVVLDSTSECEDLPSSGNILVTRGAETATINFSNCAYTVN